MSNVNVNTILALDVATHYTGYSVFTRGNITPIVYSLTGYGNITATHTDKWQDRCLEMSSKISHLIHSIKPGCLVLEYPTYQGGTKGQAASRSGGTLEMAYLCGRIAVCWEYYISKVRLDTKVWLELPFMVPYAQWAGQVNKKITCRRLKENFNIDADPDSIANNWADAIMMGRWFINERLGLRTVSNADAKEVAV
jgi:hypothetical protein